MGLSSYGGSTESSGQVRCTLDLSSSIEGKNVLVVEDIIDTGLSIHFLKNNLNNRKPKSLRFCTLLDKPENRKINFTPEFVGFTIPNKFVVGYGLDYDQKYRNLPFIGVLHFEN